MAPKSKRPSVVGESIEIVVRACTAASDPLDKRQERAKVVLM